MEYRRWADLCRECARLAGGRIPPAESVIEVTMVACYKPPASWSDKKRRSSIGGYKRTKCDGDNALKSACDALWKNDERLGDLIVRRRYAERDETIITIRLSMEH